MGSQSSPVEPQYRVQKQHPSLPGTPSQSASGKKGIYIKIGSNIAKHKHLWAMLDTNVTSSAYSISFQNSLRVAYKHFSGPGQPKLASFMDSVRSDKASESDLMPSRWSDMVVGPSWMHGSLARVQVPLESPVSLRAPGLGHLGWHFILLFGRYRYPL